MFWVNDAEASYIGSVETTQWRTTAPLCRCAVVWFLIGRNQSCPATPSSDCPATPVPGLAGFRTAVCPAAALPVSVQCDVIIRSW